MSKFFRSLDPDDSSFSASSSESEDEIDDSTSQVTQEQPPRNEVESIVPALSGLSLPPGPSVDGAHSALLLHALLEERCINEVLGEHTRNGRHHLTAGDERVRTEARSRYQQLCTILAPHNLVSPGLEHDSLALSRQRYRDGLDMLSQSNLDDAMHASNIPGTARKLLTDSVLPSSAEQKFIQDNTVSPVAALAAIAPPHPILEPSRYLRDFDDLGVLGRGGYGTVYHVQHKLDNMQYAVKKVPISPARVARIRTRGHGELDDLLRELRMLAKLDHPNIVRYFAGWIEWTNVGISSPAVRTFDDIGAVVDYSEDANVGAESSRSESLHRVVTESNSSEAGIVFETGDTSKHDGSLQSDATQSISSNRILYGSPAFSDASNSTSMMSSSLFDGTLQRTSTPTLALHLQMGLYPLTLADYLCPPTPLPDSTTTGAIPPLTHCFHLGPSITILLALLDGITYLHAHNIVHRDLKPANIFLSTSTNHDTSKRSNNIKTSNSTDQKLCPDCHRAASIPLDVRIGDFGLVTDLARPTDSLPLESETLRPPIAVGTELYRPLATTAKISLTSPGLDFYALGIIAFELLWKFETRMERHTLIQRLKETGDFPPRFADDLGGDEGGRQLRQWIRELLSGGFEDAREVKASLLAVQSSLHNQRAQQDT